MKVLYFDCSSGISGNMTLGALSELIDDPHYLVNELKKLNVDGYHIHISKEKKNGITGTYVDVHLEYEHHHEHDENCTCGCHDHDHHHHHHADEVFTSWGIETPNTYSAEDIEKILTALDSGEYGAILRAKGMVPAPDGTWVYYDYVPEEHDIRSGKPEVTGKICVIGSKLDEDKLAELFRK